MKTADVLTRKLKDFSLSIQELVSRQKLGYPNRGMLRKLVTLLMLFIAFANVTFAAGMACDVAGSEEMSMCVVDDEHASISGISSAAPYVAAQHPQDDNCGDTSKHPQPSFHHCHFGHCGVIMTYTKFAPFVSHSEYGFDLQNLALKSFIANLFRPPIA